MENKEEQKISKTIEDKNLIESLIYLKKSNLIKESKSVARFETVGEAEKSSREEIVATINEKLNGLKQDISELQKAGYALKLEGIKLLQVPLKTKIWLATLEKKDLKNIFKIQKDVEIIISPMKKEYEKNQKEE